VRTNNFLLINNLLTNIVILANFELSYIKCQTNSSSKNIKTPIVSFSKEQSSVAPFIKTRMEYFILVTSFIFFGFEVLTSVPVKIIIFWDVTPYISVVIP
jgi:hypothetical protein